MPVSPVPNSDGVFRGWRRRSSRHQLPSLSRLQNRIDYKLQILVRAYDFDFDFGDKIYSVLRTTIDFGVPLLASKTRRDGHSMNALLGERS